MTYEGSMNSAVIEMVEMVQGIETLIENGSTSLGLNSRVLRQSVGTTIVEVKAGATQLTDRKQIIIVNNSSVFINLSFDPTVPLETAITLITGQSITIDLDPTVYVPIYGRTVENTSSILVGEVN